MAPGLLSLFPDTAEVEDGELRIGGVPASALAEGFGTPLVVYCKRTIQHAARAYRSAGPEALLLYSLKALPNVAILRLLAREGRARKQTRATTSFARPPGRGRGSSCSTRSTRSTEQLPPA